MYRATVHFTDNRPSVVLPAGEFNLRRDYETNPESGLRRYSVVTPDGDEIPVFLDPACVAAVIPSLAGDGKNTKSRPSSSSDAKDNTASEHDQERTVLRFLCRFVAAKTKQLDRMLKVEAIRTDRLKPEKEKVDWIRFVGLEREKLEEMRQSDLVRIDDPFYLRDNESVCTPTEKGYALAGLEGLPPPPVTSLAYGYRQYLEMVDLHLAIMRGTDEDLIWITNRELDCAEQRAICEKELERPLPTVVPPVHKAWPADPEALVFLKRRKLLVAIGLELTKVSDRRLKAYREILDGYSRNPEIDRVNLFFTRQEALEKVRELSENYEQSKEKRLFVFHRLPEDPRAQIVL